MENGGLLTREQIFAADDTPFEEVRIPQWGGTVRVKTMNAVEGAAFVELISQKEWENHFREALVITCVVDEKDVPIFSEEDRDTLKKRGARPFTAVFKVAAQLNGFGEGAVKEAEKNS